MGQVQSVEDADKAAYEDFYIWTTKLGPNGLEAAFMRRELARRKKQFKKKYGCAELKHSEDRVAKSLR
jgi:hypothetical protein